MTACRARPPANLPSPSLYTKVISMSSSNRSNMPQPLANKQKTYTPNTWPAMKRTCKIESACDSFLYRNPRRLDMCICDGCKCQFFTATKSWWKIWKLPKMIWLLVRRGNTGLFFSLPMWALQAHESENKCSKVVDDPRFWINFYWVIIDTILKALL